MGTLPHFFQDAILCEVLFFIRNLKVKKILKQNSLAAGRHRGIADRNGEGAKRASRLRGAASP